MPMRWGKIGPYGTGMKRVTNVYQLNWIKIQTSRGCVGYVIDFGGWMVGHKGPSIIDYHVRTA
jgi:hypothetical protein